MSFFELAAGVVGKLAISVAGRCLGEEIKDLRTQRRMQRMVDDAVDRIVAQVDDYLNSEGVNEHRKEVLITSLASSIQPLVDEPQRLFAGNLDGNLIFKQCHPNGELPQEIREEDLGHFYTMLFPQIAHFLAGSRTALVQWQAEGYREEFKRLAQIADEIRAVSAKVADLPASVVQAGASKAEKEADTLLRELAQTLFNNLLLALDLSPLRAERSLSGSLRDHFVAPAFRERSKDSAIVAQGSLMVKSLASQGARHVIYGGPGVGKSTWARWFQSRLLESAPGSLAVVLRLRELPDIQHRSLLDLLRARAGVHLRDALSDGLLRTWHAQGRFTVILDGFDEVPEDRRNAVQKWIKDLAAVAQRTSIIVTSRPLQSGHLESLEAPWQQWDLLPFDEPRIVEFIERWHRYMPANELSDSERKVDSQALARSFSLDPSLKPLADTPLMLGTLLFVHHRDKRLPSGRVDLYERYIGAMLGLRDSGMGIQAGATRLSDREKRRVLGHIALHFHLSSVNEVSDAQMRQLTQEALTAFHLQEDVDRLLVALCERTGLLQGPGAWSFMHKTIGEFLVAELICEGITRLPDERRLDRKELWNHRHEDQWTVVLFFWAGKTSLRELEEFLSDLLHEKGPKAPVLALSLLDDQGYRLPPSIRRLLAEAIIKKPLEFLPEFQANFAIVLAPPFVKTGLSASCSMLRGLSPRFSTQAFARLFASGLLEQSAISQSRGDMRDDMTVALFWAFDHFGLAWTLEVRKHLSHLPQCELGLICLSFCCRSTSSEPLELEKCRHNLSEWLVAFPEGRGWLSLLLLPCEADRPLGKVSQIAPRKVVGPILWERINEPMDDDWLRESDDFRAHNHFHMDVLEKGRVLLRKHAPEEWGLTVNQHSDLVGWCGRLMTRRKELKRNKPKEPRK